MRRVLHVLDRLSRGVHHHRGWRKTQRTREKFGALRHRSAALHLLRLLRVDACPEDAIYMTRDYEMAIDTRARAVVGLRDLVVPPNFPVEPMGWRPYYGGIQSAAPRAARAYGPVAARGAV
jgi:hypothetical protein